MVEQNKKEESPKLSPKRTAGNLLNNYLRNSSSKKEKQNQHLVVNKTVKPREDSTTVHVSVLTGGNHSSENIQQDKSKSIVEEKTENITLEERMENLSPSVSKIFEIEEEDYQFFKDRFNENVKLVSKNSAVAD